MAIFDALLGTSSTADPLQLTKKLDGILIANETVHIGFEVIRDFFAFTEKRIIIVDVQGYTSKKISYLSIPYRAITRFQVETSGTFDIDSELKIWVSGSDVPIEKQLKMGTDIRGIQQALATGIFG